jgi:Flp pilus assembly protein TadG
MKRLAPFLRPRSRLKEFFRHEAGSVTYLSLTIFVMILSVGGIAVDMMRYESQRARLQSTADRAALAAASLTQPFDPREVVEDYFAKEGLSEFLVDVTIDEGLNFRNVEVRTAAVVPSLFMKWVGVSELGINATSAAEERYTEVEVALVLDLSNSMNRVQRIDNLRVAGAEFVNVLFANNSDDRISLTVVPYTGQVNAGAALLSNYTTTHGQPWSHCVEFGAGDFGNLDLSTEATLTGAGHFDPWHTSRAPQMFFCPTHPGATGEITPMSITPGALSARITDMIADGNTSIDIGLKWALALLDPTARPVVDNLIDDGIVPVALAGRPLAHEEEGKLKVVVIMTDGENWDEFRLRNGYKVGPSPIWHTVERTPELFTEISGMINGTVIPDAFQRFRPDNVTMPQQVGSVLSVRRPSDGRYFRPNPTQTNPTNGSWVGSYPSNVTPASCTLHEANDYAHLNYDVWICPDHIAYRMDYAWLWHNFSVRWVAQRIYSNAGIRTTSQYVNDVLTSLAPSTKDARLFSLCNLARDTGIPIFTVAFEAPANGINAMRTCATSPNHFFDVQGVAIRDAFRTIAGNIQNLRLVQ